MKNHHLFLFIGLAVLLVMTASCNLLSPGSKSVNITAKLSTILANFDPYDEGDFDMEGYKVKLTCLLYDSEGNLVWNDAYSLKDFNTDHSFTIEFPEAEKGKAPFVKASAGPLESYKLVMLAYCYEGSVSNPSKEAYKLTGIESINTLEIEQDKPFQFYGMLGSYVGTLEKKNGEVEVEMKPATALVYTWFYNIHAHDNGLEPTVSDLYGSYTAKATNYWGTNTYSWTITLEAGNSGSNSLLIKDFDPWLYSKGYYSTSYNTYNAQYQNGVITIPKGQQTGVSNSFGSIVLLGGTINDSWITYEDILLDVTSNGLVSRNMFGIRAYDDDGWYSLFNPGVSFTKKGASSSSNKVSKYAICFRCPNVGEFSGSAFSYFLDYGDEGFYTTWVSPESVPKYDNVYSFVNYFPGTTSILGRTTLTNDKKVDTAEQNVSVQAGRQYEMIFDCDSFDLSFGSATKTGSFENATMLDKPVKPSPRIKQLFKLN